MTKTSLPRLDFSKRKILSKGADFLCCELQVTAPTQKTDSANRIELWRLVPKTKLKKRLTQENYFDQLTTTGPERVWFWEDNARLAQHDGQAWELEESKSKRQWR